MGRLCVYRGIVWYRFQYGLWGGGYRTPPPMPYSSRKSAMLLRVPILFQIMDISYAHTGCLGNKNNKMILLLCIYMKHVVAYWICFTEIYRYVRILPFSKGVQKRSKGTNVVDRSVRHPLIATEGPPGPWTHIIPSSCFRPRSSGRYKDRWIHGTYIRW